MAHVEKTLHKILFTSYQIVGFLQPKKKWYLSFFLTSCTAYAVAFLFDDMNPDMYVFMCAVLVGERNREFW